MLRSVPSYTQTHHHCQTEKPVDYTACNLESYSAIFAA